MEAIRAVVTMGLKARQTSGIPVRQPLAKIVVRTVEDSDAILDSKLLEIISQELNIKEVEWEWNADQKEAEVVLDTAITPELKKEGDYRELVRAIQDMRKKEGLTPSDPIALTLPESARETASGFEDDLKKTVLADSVAYSGDAIVIAKK